MTPDRPRIVIAGGGNAGMLLATKLGDRLGKHHRADIVLVDPNLAHIWKPMLHEFAAGSADARQEKLSYVAHADRHHFQYWPGALQALDRASRRVTLAPFALPDGAEDLAERTFDYDVLVMAVGSQANDFGTDGVAEHCHFIDDLDQAHVFNEHLRSAMMRASANGSDLAVAIVGGGSTGVELAAQISQVFDIAGSYGAGDLRDRLRMTLIESGERILASFPEHISQLANEELKRLRIEVLTDAKVVTADDSGFQLASDRRIEARLRVWAAGVKAPALLASLDGLETARGNRLTVSPSLQTTTDPQIFALGDCASLTPAGADRPLPSTAQVARQQTLHLAKHLPALLDKASPIPDFAYRDYGSLVSLGGYEAYGTLGQYGFFKGGFLKGRFAQLSHAMLYRLHQIDLHGFWRGSLVWLAGDLNRVVQPRIRLD